MLFPENPTYKIFDVGLSALANLRKEQKERCGALFCGCVGCEPCK